VHIALLKPTFNALQATLRWYMTALACYCLISIPLSKLKLHSTSHVRPHTAMDPLYAQLLGHVSSYALGQIWVQRHQLASPDPVPACIKTFRTCMGMPCSHEIRIHLDENASLTLEDVHSHWHFLLHAVAAAQPLVLEPAVAEVRGRPSAAKERPQRRPNRATGARQLTLTLRQPSAFKRIDNRASIRTRSQCLLEPTI
jgi:hypothetical protein